MTKPLELTVYEDDGLPAPPSSRFLHHTFGHGDHCEGWGCYPKHKRFTDAELAAEYWRQYSVYVREASNLLHCQERYIEAGGGKLPR